MKSREARRTIQVNASMRADHGWQDVTIRNVSAHGMKIAVSMPLRHGAVIEIRHAGQIIVARTVWVRGCECGMRTQDVIDIPALLNPKAAQAQTMVRDARADRGIGWNSIDETAARSQRFAIRFQFAVLAAAVIVAVGYAGLVVSDVLSAPMAAIYAALDRKPQATKDAQ